MRFHAVLQLNWKTATGIPIPLEVMSALGGGKRPAVRVTFAGYSHRTTIGSVDGAPMLPISAQVREASGVRAGDELEVEIELDTEPREVAVPPDFGAALAAEPMAETFFETLNRSEKRWHLLPIEGAKTDETRQRRIAKSVAMLREGRRQR